ncbi:hypothetical protein CLAVI_000031 [Candidatus Clavichlamydia salmonicola]|uniref:MarC family protein n=1 Tax=Candidatus Clavichlamydia salmonicola TaxID=469812 RepID=UPI001890DD13|nr:MarC family protein [Candidatus Clavichlamydia salmonicola]MBF5050429.1 hypothetical protein [Candidatus Clavichlamydia salmonicola]
MTSFLSILSLASILLMTADMYSNLSTIGSMVGTLNPRQRASLVLRESLINIPVMLLFLVLGKTLANLLNFSEAVTYLGGGVTIFFLGFTKILFKKDSKTAFDSKFFKITALSIPFLAGPSWFASMITLAYSPMDYGSVVFAVFLTAVVSSFLSLIFFTYGFNLLKNKGFGTMENIFSLVALLLGAEKFIIGLKLIITSL